MGNLSTGKVAMDPANVNPPDSSASAPPSTDPSTPSPEAPPLARIPMARRVVLAPRYYETSRPIKPPSPLLMLELTPMQAAFDAMLLLLIPIGVVYIPSFLLWCTAEPDSNPLELDASVFYFKWVEAGFAVLLAVYLSLRGGVKAVSMGVRMPAVGPTIGWGLSGLAGAYGIMLLTAIALLPSLLGGAKGGGIEQLQDRMDFAEAMAKIKLSDVAIGLIAVVVHEELLFRGLLLPQLRRVTGSWAWAALLSSIVFGMLHFAQGWFGMIQTFGISLVFCSIFIASRSLLTVLIAHYLFDLCQFMLIRWLIPWLDDSLHRVAMPQIGPF